MQFFEGGELYVHFEKSDYSFPEARVKFYAQ